VFSIEQFLLAASLLICFLRFATFILYYRSLLVELFSEEWTLLLVEMNCDKLYYVQLIYWCWIILCSLWWSSIFNCNLSHDCGLVIV